MFKNKKWMNRHLLMLFILVFTQLFSSLLGVLNARANSPNTEIQHVKIFSRNQELTADDAHPIEMFQDDVEVFTLERSGINEMIMEVPLQEGLHFDVEKTLEHNQNRLIQEGLTASIQVPADRLVQERLETDGVHRKLLFHFQQNQQRIDFVLKPIQVGIYEIYAKWSDLKPMQLDQATMEEVIISKSGYLSVSEKVVESLPMTDGQSEASQESSGTEESMTNDSGSDENTNALQSEVGTTTSPEATMAETDSTESTSQQLTNESSTTTQADQDESQGLSTETSTDESKVEKSEQETSEHQQVEGTEESKAEDSSNNLTENNAEKSSDSASQIEKSEKKLDSSQVTGTENQSADGSTRFRSAATVRNADIGDGPIVAYFEKSSESILSGESGRYKIYFKVSGALVDKVKNVQAKVQLPTEVDYYSLPSDLTRMAIKGVVPVHDNQANTLTWDFPELLTGQIYETMLQVDSKNGIIPNNHNMTSALTISTEGNQVYSSGPVSIQVKSNKPAISVTKTFLGKNGVPGTVLNRGDEI
ncbi:TPA: hypothetical protein U0J99_001412 [Streptococcus suis]|nr:hypothetical protein [Streptococcus suis]